MLEVHGVSRLLSSFHDIIPDFVFSGVFFSDTFLNSHPEQAKAFLRGLVKSFVFIREHGAEARGFIPKYTGVQLDVAMVCAIRDFSVTGREPNGFIDHQRDLMVKFGSLSKSVSLDPVIDYSYLPQ
jgi:ABC-type nitrate/sulfonate/bicarbonate transport system substrate-binding protein